MGLFKEFLLFTLFYNIIRIFAFGMHASKSYICLITSIIIFITMPYLALVINVHIILKITLSIFSFVMIALYAPADTHKRPLIKVQKRRRLKTASLLITILYIVIILLSDNALISNIVLLALITEIILILPITYRFFKVPYRNYNLYYRNGN